jgi:hypothetical protein
MVHTYRSTESAIYTLLHVPINDLRIGTCYYPLPARKDQYIPTRTRPVPVSKRSTRFYPRVRQNTDI